MLPYDRDFSLTCRRWCWNPNFTECFPRTHCKFSCRMKSLFTSWNARELVPRHCTVAFGPAKLTSGNDESASPGGSPLIPALIGHCPSMVAFVIGTYSRETPKLTWFNSDGRITQLSLARATVGTSSTSRVSAYGSGIGAFAGPSRYGP